MRKAILKSECPSKKSKVFARDEIRIIIIRINSRIFTEMKIRIINLNIRIFERLLICHFPPKIGFHTSNFSAKL